LAASKTDVTYYELKEMAKNSIRTAFVDDKTKAALLDKLAQQFTTFERQFAAPVKQ
jgi:adenosine deaminase